MNKLYWISFETYYAYQVGGLTYSRIGKSCIVEITKLDDVSFYEHFKMILLGNIGRRLCSIANAIEYKIKVVRGFEKDIQWIPDGNGFIAYDKKCGEYVIGVKVKQIPVSKHGGK